MSADEEEVSVSQLIARSIAATRTIEQAFDSSSAATQTQVTKASSDLQLAASLVSHLALFSPNEALSDLPTSHLPALLLPSLLATLILLVRTRSSLERIASLEKAQGFFRYYLKQADQYAVVPQHDLPTYAGPSHALVDPSRRREQKIAQFKLEKSLQTTYNELELRTANGGEVDEEVQRDLYLSMLRLHYLRANAELASIDMELELLRHSTKMSDLPSPAGARGGERLREIEDDGSWKVEKVPDPDGPILDPNGKVLRNFTILPSSSSQLSTRLRFQEGVFRPSHRLPTMTIDELLDEERARGNILQGGGPRTTDEVDQARKDDKALEEEDNLEGWEQEEAGLQKKREWDDWKDSHRKGEGNMHNRG